MGLMADAPLIIGVGNRRRRADGAGPAVVDALAGQGFETVEVAGDCARLIDLWAGRDVVHVVDATRSGAASGAVLRIDATAAAVPRGRFLHTTLDVGLAEAAATAKILGRAPGRLVLWGIEGADFGHGEALSAAVAAAVNEVAARLTAEVSEAADA